MQVKNSKKQVKQHNVVKQKHYRRILHRLRPMKIVNLR